MINNIGKFIIFLGLILIILGLIIQYLPKIKFLGKLPGDIYIKKGNFVFYFPITTSILISLIISLLFLCLRK
jgi:hypothetical protein